MDVHSENVGGTLSGQWDTMLAEWQIFAVKLADFWEQGTGKSVLKFEDFAVCGQSKEISEQTSSGFIKSLLVLYNLKHSKTEPGGGGAKTI